jgi:queuosine precursor transporter
MNEIVFILHSIVATVFCLAALRLGKQALVAFICMQGVLSNLFVTKQIVLFSFNVTCSDVFAVSSILGLNLLQEFHGKEIVKKTIITNFFMLSFYMIMTQFQLWYDPNLFDSMHPHFYKILHLMPRIAISSATSYLFVQITDAYLYSFLKRILENKHLPLRNAISLMSSQLIDTTLFTMLALYGVVQSVSQVIAVSYMIKLVVIGCSIPFVILTQKIICKR